MAWFNVRRTHDTAHEYVGGGRRCLDAFYDPGHADFQEPHSYDNPPQWSTSDAGLTFINRLRIHLPDLMQMEIEETVHSHSSAAPQSHS